MGFRFYKIDGELYPSVTTIIDHTERNSLSSLKRRAKEYDEANGEGAWENKRIVASQRGMIIHTLVQNALSPGGGIWLEMSDDELLEDGVIEEALPYWHSVKPHLQSLLCAYPALEVVWSELPVFNPSLRYCGRPDLVINLNDPKEGMRLMLIDVKTFGGYTNKWHGEVNEWRVWATRKNQTRPEQPGWDWLTYRPAKAFIQLAMYAMALESMAAFKDYSATNNSLGVIGSYKLDDLCLWVINPKKTQVVNFWSNRGDEKSSYHWLWNEAKSLAEQKCSKFWKWYEQCSDEDKANAEIIPVDLSYLTQNVSTQSDLIPF